VDRIKKGERMVERFDDFVNDTVRNPKPETRNPKPEI